MTTNLKKVVRNFERRIGNYFSRNLFENNLRASKEPRWPPGIQEPLHATDPEAKISDDLFLVIDQKFRIPPIFPVSVHFPPVSRKLLFPPYFDKFPPLF